MNYRLENRTSLKDIEQNNDIFILTLSELDPTLAGKDSVYKKGNYWFDIHKEYGKIFGEIVFETENLEITEDMVNELIEFVDSNIETLLMIFNNQSNDEYCGGDDILTVTYKNYKFMIKSTKTSMIDKLRFANIRRLIKDIVKKHKVTKIDELSEEYRQILNKCLFRIERMAEGTITNIAEIISYNPEEKLVDPLTQGMIFQRLVKECENRRIKISEINDDLGGLAFNYNFKVEHIEIK